MGLPWPYGKFHLYYLLKIYLWGLMVWNVVITGGYYEYSAVYRSNFVDCYRCPYTSLYWKNNEDFEKTLFCRKSKGAIYCTDFFGIVLVIGAFVCTQVFFLSFILGVLALLKGLYLIMGPMPQIKRLMDWWFNKASASYIRLCGLIIFVLGIALLSNL